MQIRAKSSLKRIGTEEEGGRTVMTTVVKAVKRSIVSLELAKPTPMLISQATHLVSQMTGNPYFPTPNPPLATVSTAITALQTAQTAVAARVHGAVASRNEKQKALGTLLEHQGVHPVGGRRELRH